ncbi:MAG: S8 family serine peptidase [bacterium]
MRARWLALAVIVVAVGTGAAGGPRPNRAVAEAPDEYVVVQFNTGRAVEDLGPDGLPPTLEQRGYRQLRVPSGQSAAEYARELRARSDVLYADEEPKVYAATIPNDPYYQASQSSYLSALNAPAAWDLTTGSNQVVVAVLDTGIDYTHPEFAGHLWENPIDNQNDGIDRDGNGCINDRYGCRFINLTSANQAICGYSESTATGAVRDDHGTSKDNIGSHGTMVAGIIGASGNNGSGVAGVAWSVRLMSVKVLDCGSGPAGAPSGWPFNVAQGIDYAVRMGARIINLSLATPAGDLKGDIPYLREVLQNAQNQGVIVVAAAGNHQPGSPEVGTGYPAAYTQFSNLLAVGAADNMNGNVWATYSNYGPALDFAAPASKLATTARTDLGLSNPYATDDSGGTSFSAPLVTGMFALMMSRNSKLGAAEYIQIARDTATAAATAPHGQNWAGSGIINIGAAVARIPMTITGSPLKDFRDVPAGTAIDAIIDGTLCGQANADAFGRLSRYSLRVKSNAELAGCGQPGKVVQTYIGGAPAVPTFPWGGQNEDLGLSNKDISTVSPPPGAVVVQALNGAWANISHLEDTGALPGATSGLPTPWNSIYKWDPLKRLLDKPGAYQRFYRNAPTYASDLLTISQFDAYWVDGPPTNVASLNPNPAPGRSIALHAGWNNFTYTGTSRAVGDALSSISGKYTQVLQFDNSTSSWLSYLPGQPRYLNDFGGLFMLKVYWVLVTDEVSLVMN